MVKIKTLKSWNEDHTKRVPIAPRTHVKAVFDNNGNTLDSLMAVQDEKLTELGSEVGKIYEPCLEKVGSVYKFKESSVNRSIILSAEVKKGDIVNIYVTEDTSSNTSIDVYQDTWGGTMIKSGLQDFVQYVSPNDFSQIVFYNNNSANGYSVDVKIERGGVLKNLEDALFGYNVTDEVQLTTASDYNNVMRLTKEILNGTSNYYIKVSADNVKKWYAYSVVGGSYVNLGAHDEIGEFISIDIPKEETLNGVGIFIFKDDIVRDGKAFISYKINGEIENALKGIEENVDKIKEGIGGGIVSISGITNNRSLTLDIECLKGEILHIKIENDAVQEHLFTIYKNEWGGELLERTSETEFDYLATSSFNRVVFYNDNSSAGYKATVSIMKDNRFDSLEKRMDGVEAIAGKVDIVDGTIEIGENPLSVIRRDAGFASMFLKWGFIGDSLSSGEHNCTLNGESTYVDFYEYSWGQYICRICGAEGYNFSFGGQTALGWITNTKADGVTPISEDKKERTWSGAKKNLKDVYVIALGVNDVKFESSVGNLNTDIGTYNPSTDTDTNENTFVGHYAGIIQRIKSVQPKAKIFCVTLPKGDQSHAESYSNAIRGMAEHFSDVYIIDLYTFGVTLTNEWGYRYRNKYHLNASGYLYTAWQMMTYIDWIVRKNWKLFNNTAFIGTDYTE